MNVFVDCAKCGSEFVVDEAISGSRLRCPDCLQWIGAEDFDHNYAYSYSANSYSYSQYDDLGYQSGYDY